MSGASDPRVLFAAERTLLAWNRTGLSLMAFGFVIERFGLFMRYIEQVARGSAADRVSFWIGAFFVLIGVAAALFSVRQYLSALRSVQPADIPSGYSAYGAVWLNAAVAVFGLALLGYLAGA